MCCAESKNLRRLKTDYVKLVHTHREDHTFSAEKGKRSYIILHYSVHNYSNVPATIDYIPIDK